MRTFLPALLATLLVGLAVADGARRHRAALLAGQRSEVRAAGAATLEAVERWQWRCWDDVERAAARLHVLGPAELRSVTGASHADGGLVLFTGDGRALGSVPERTPRVLERLAVSLRAALIDAGDGAAAVVAPVEVGGRPHAAFVLPVDASAVERTALVSLHRLRRAGEAPTALDAALLRGGEQVLAAVLAPDGAPLARRGALVLPSTLPEGTFEARDDDGHTLAAERRTTDLLRVRAAWSVIVAAPLDASPALPLPGLAAALAAGGLALAAQRLARRDVLRRAGHAPGRLEGEVASSQAIARRGADAAAEVVAITGRQGHTFEEASTALQQAATMARRNAQSVQTASELGQQGMALAANAHLDVVEVKAVLTRLEDSFRAVLGIATHMDELGLQSGVLSLNASVEAARVAAGAHGFAVVAAEVRRLSTRAAELSRRTEEIIRGCGALVEAAGDRAGRAEGSLVKLVGSAEQIGVHMEEASRSAWEQSQAMAQIGDSLRHLDAVLQQIGGKAHALASGHDELGRRLEALAALAREVRAALEATREDAAAAAPTAPANVAPHDLWAGRGHGYEGPAVAGAEVGRVQGGEGELRSRRGDA